MARTTSRKEQTKTARRAILSGGFSFCLGRKRNAKTMVSAKIGLADFHFYGRMVRALRWQRTYVHRISEWNDSAHSRSHHCCARSLYRFRETTFLIHAHPRISPRTARSSPDSQTLGNVPISAAWDDALSVSARAPRRRKRLKQEPLGDPGGFCVSDSGLRPCEPFSSTSIHPHPPPHPSSLVAIVHCTMPAPLRTFFIHVYPHTPTPASVPAPRPHPHPCGTCPRYAHGAIAHVCVGIFVCRFMFCRCHQCPARAGVIE